jgi:hypothetical protein
MRASGFMNAQIAARYSNPKRVIVVSSVVMERFLARRSSLVKPGAVAVDEAAAISEEWWEILIRIMQPSDQPQPAHSLLHRRHDTALHASNHFSSTYIHTFFQFKP